MSTHTLIMLVSVASIWGWCAIRAMNLVESLRHDLKIAKDNLESTKLQNRYLLEELDKLRPPLEYRRAEERPAPSER